MSACSFSFLLSVFILRFTFLQVLVLVSDCVISVSILLLLNLICSNIY